MQKLFLIGIGLLVSLLSYGQSPGENLKVSSSNGINLRESPSSSAKSKTLVGKGEKVKLIEKTNDKWYKVEYDGEVGYVSADYVEKDDKHRDDENKNNQDRNKNNTNKENNNKEKSQRSDNSKKKNSTNSTASARDYKWGVGLRLGDPTAFTLKKYMAKNAWELSVGRGYMFYGGRRFDRNYEDWQKDWYKDHSNYKDFQRTGYTSGSFPIAVQFHYLFQRDFKPVKNLQWYWGLGGQFRFQSYQYDYRYKIDGSNTWYYGEERVGDIDLGIDGVFGAEYKFAKAPFSVFADVTLFTELVNDPFNFWLLPGVGGRYNF